MTSFEIEMARLCEQARHERKAAQDRGYVIRIPHLPRFEDEVDSFVAAASFRHGPLSGEAECDEWIAATLRKLPKGALAKLYRVLYEGHGMRIETAKSEEAKWLKSLRK